MVTGRVAAWFAVASLASATACEAVVDDGRRVLGSEDAGEDVAEAGGPDVVPSEVASGAECAPACLGPATSCLQTCTAAEASCMSTCHGHNSGPCQDQCAQVDSGCSNVCRSQCVACFTQAACAGSGACSS
jgi:hypothetical protein